MMVGPVEHPRHRTVTALRSSQLSLTFSAAISTGRRNTLSEPLCWRLILQGLTRAFVKLPCDCAEFSLGMDG
jgi:hypothetical protein